MPSSVTRCGGSRQVQRCKNVISKSLFSVTENKMHEGAGGTRGLEKTGLEPKMQDFIVHREKPQFTEQHEK